MSENGTCGCGKPVASCPTPAVKTEAKADKADTSSKKAGTIQNGKGSAPRNMSAGFRSNYKNISWSSDAKLTKGERFVKKY